MPDGGALITRVDYAAWWVLLMHIYHQSLHSIMLRYELIVGFRRLVVVDLPYIHKCYTGTNPIFYQPL